jgi:hypothetical protein
MFRKFLIYPRPTYDTAITASTAYLISAQEARLTLLSRLKLSILERVKFA